MDDNVAVSGFTIVDVAVDTAVVIVVVLVETIETVVVEVTVVVDWLGPTPLAV